MKRKQNAVNTEVVCPPVIEVETKVLRNETGITFLLYKGRIVARIDQHVYKTHTEYVCEGRRYLNLESAIKQELERIMASIFDNKGLV